jgi:hypothetical protein
LVDNDVTAYKSVTYLNWHGMCFYSGATRANGADVG